MKTGKYIGLNLLSMFIVAGLLVWGILKGLDIYTRHGQAIVVPDVKGLSATQATELLRRHNLETMVSDSNYIKEKTPGSVLELTPAAGDKVKEGRTIYLTINTYSTPLFTVPDVADNSSVRQAQGRMLAAGFKLTENELIPGEKDWVYGVVYNGKELEHGQKVPAGATLTLIVGDGHAHPSMQNDSIDALEIDVQQHSVPATTTSHTKQEEHSWF